MPLASKYHFDTFSKNCLVGPVTNSLSTVGGVSAAVSKTAAAPIERVKLLIQNQVYLIFIFVLIFGWLFTWDNH